MKNKIALLSVLSLAACGGGGGGGSSGASVSAPSGTVLNGVAASGGPVASGTVQATMTSALGPTLGPSVPCGVTSTDAQGNFSIDISACMSSGGFVVLSTVDATGRTLLSAYTPSMNNSLTGAAYINITPLTTLVLAAAGGNTVANALTSLNTSVSSFQTAGLPSALAQANSVALLAGLQVAPKMALAEAATSVMSWSTWNGGDLFTTPFKADHSGIDAVLDSVSLSGTGDMLVGLSGTVLEQPTGTSLATGNYATTNWPTAVSSALAQAYLSPTTLEIFPTRVYAGTVNGTGSCSLNVSLSTTATPGTASGTCSSPTIGTISLTGTIGSNGQASLTNGAGITFTGGITAMGGAGTWTNGTTSGTWTVY